MAHLPLLTTFFRVELIASTLLIILLLILGVVKRKELLSDAAASKLRLQWSKFTIVFYLGLVAMVLFLILLATEIVEAGTGAVFRSLYPVQTEWIKVSLVFVLFFVNLTNLYILLKLVGGGE
jgi:hypothetical protein